MKNPVTITLTGLAVAGMVYAAIDLFFQKQSYPVSIFLLALCIIIILEIIPIQMVSGEAYSASSIIVFFLTVYHGLEFAIIAIFIGTAAYFINNFKTVKFPVLPFLVTIGMYILANTVAFSVWKSLDLFNVWIAVGAAVFAYELANVILLETIEKVTYGEKMFTNFKEKLKEMVLPVLVSMIVIPRLLLLKTPFDIVITMLYTLFFILVIIFFSRLLTEQISLRRSTSRAFISILEQSISDDLTGHGNRVAFIIETLINDFNYPKRKRNNLLQAAIIHDIGKSLLPAYIFTKKGAMTVSEEREYQTHPEKAAEALKSMSVNSPVTDWILHHHERWDGKGFPHQLQGKNIPIEARILALGNELDLILSRHADQETILELLREKSGNMLDPGLVAKVELHHIETILRNIDASYKVCEDIQPHIPIETDGYASVGESFFIEVKNGKISMPKDDLPADFFCSLAETALKMQKPIHESYVDKHTKLDIHALPHQNGDVTLFIHDMKPMLDYRKHLEEKIMESYEDVIHTLSKEKIKLHSSKEKLEQMLGEQIGEIPINATSDVPRSRQFIKPFLEKHPTEVTTMKIHLSVTEAITNIIKHATGGTFSIYHTTDTVQFLITDKGSGILLHEIPKTILVTGYSSKRSLGQGFNMIAKFSDYVQIHTSSEGTSILLEYRKKESHTESHEESSISS